MTKKNVLLVSLTCVAAAVLAAFFMPIPVGGQAGPVKPGEGHPSWNSQMLTHQRPGVRAI